MITTSRENYSDRLDTIDLYYPHTDWPTDPERPLRTSGINMNGTKGMKCCSPRTGPSSPNFKSHHEIFAAQPHFLCGLQPASPERNWTTTISNIKKKMAPINLSHRRTHNLLLISKLLSLRDTASPLTLVLDSLEQPATPLLKEYIRRAKVYINLEYYHKRHRRCYSRGWTAMLTSSTAVQSPCHTHRLRNPEAARWSRCFCINTPQEPCRYS